MEIEKEGSAKTSGETHVLWLSCLKHKIRVWATSHVAEMSISRDALSPSAFRVLAGPSHTEISLQTCGLAQMDPILRSLLLFLSLSAQVGEWEAVQIKITAISHKMLTKTKQPQAGVARKHPAPSYVLLPFVCIHSSDFLIHILCLRPNKEFPLQVGTESSPLQVPRWFNFTSDCCKWLQLLHFSLAESWQNSHSYLCTGEMQTGQLSFT